VISDRLILLKIDIRQKKLYQGLAKENIDLVIITNSSVYIQFAVSCMNVQ
jgi:hypothetical protein